MTPDPGFDDETVDGHTLDELGDYLDRGRVPPDPAIDQSADCQVALASLERLRRISESALSLEVAERGEVDEGWLRGILSGISREARAGRDIPLPSPEPVGVFRITEGAVRGLIRSAGDAVDGLVIGRCRLTGDVTEPGAPIVVDVDASVLWGVRIDDAADRLRAAIARQIERHTALVVDAIDITVHDVHSRRVREGDRR